MKRLVFAIILIFASATLFAQTITNVVARQEGNNVVVSYDIDKASPTVQLTVSTDGGKTYSAPLIQVSGDVMNVQPGRRRIVWDVLAEVDKLSGDNIVFNVVAEREHRFIDGHEYVDLGLSVKWATCNVGATKPEQCGGYYQWAGTNDVTSTSNNLDKKNCPYHTGLNIKKGWIKYNTDSSCGTVDNKTVLDLSNDAAHVNWGGSWRMPTDDELMELKVSCTWTWTTQNGVNGYKVTSKKSGYTGNSIFLPAAGYRDDDDLDYVNAHGCYWSSSLDAEYPGSAYFVRFSLDNVSRDHRYRHYGISVRPVTE